MAEAPERYSGGANPIWGARGGARRPQQGRPGRPAIGGRAGVTALGWLASRRRHPCPNRPTVPDRPWTPHRQPVPAAKSHGPLHNGRLAQEALLGSCVPHDPHNLHFQNYGQTRQPVCEREPFAVMRLACRCGLRGCGRPQQSTKAQAQIGQPTGKAAGAAGTANPASHRPLGQERGVALAVPSTVHWIVQRHRGREVEGWRLLRGLQAHAPLKSLLHSYHTLLLAVSKAYRSPEVIEPEKGSKE